MEKLKALAKLIRYYILISTTQAHSGHPTSSLSAVDLLTVLLFGGIFKYDLDSPTFPNNDRLIFSKGHAAPLLYALYGAAGKISEEELKTLRKFGSQLEGHPTMVFPYTEAATGSLGQGLSIGVGMAINAKYLDKLPYKTYVLMGDGETSEGSLWEAIQIASHYKLDNLVGIIDVNRLGQRGPTMLGWDLKTYQKRIQSFGWQTFVLNGHDFAQIYRVFQKSEKVKGKPVMLIAKTVKGKGVSFWENKEGFHGKALSEQEQQKALEELGSVEKNIRGEIIKPANLLPPATPLQKPAKISYSKGEAIATRQAYGQALVRIFPQFPNLIALDGEVSNSTFSQIFQKSHPERFFEMYIGEQNMVSTALGLSLRGKIPFVSTFSAFLTRAFDQIRMAQYSKANIKFVGSHAGVAIGEDGPSQMGLEDLAMFRTILDSVVFYPADAVSCEKLVEQAAQYRGIVYIRTTRNDTPVIYDTSEEFPLGGSKILKSSKSDKVTVVSAGITLFEALSTYQNLKKDKINIRVIDLYSIKPLDSKTLSQAAQETKAIITVEDHFAQGGIGEAVQSALQEKVPVYCLAVRKMPKSGTAHDLLDYEEISQQAIEKKVKEILES